MWFQIGVGFLCRKDEGFLPPSAQFIGEYGASSWDK
jgi:hypothetical protein